MDNTVRLVGSIVDWNSLKVIGYILYVEKTGNITIIDARFLPSLLAPFSELCPINMLKELLWIRDLYL